MSHRYSDEQLANFIRLYETKSWNIPPDLANWYHEDDAIDIVRDLLGTRARIARYEGLEKIAKSICEVHEKRYRGDLSDKSMLSAYINSARRLLSCSTIEEWEKLEEI